MRVEGQTETVTSVTNGEAPHERWIRLPTKGQCPCTGLSRPFYYQLIRDGKIKSASLKRPGCLTGVRLVWLPSVLAYIEKRIDKTGGRP